METKKTKKVAIIDTPETNEILIQKSGLKKVGVVEKRNKLMEARAAAQQAEIEKQQRLNLEYPDIFKDVPIGKNFKNVKGVQFKKTSGFAAYRNKVGLYTFEPNAKVKII